jgi:hypothetical protein
MRHPERVEDYLGHIAEAIARATGYVQPLRAHPVVPGWSISRAGGSNPKRGGF